jgi:multicomponent Na+:H+ antiporter subunit A
VLLSRPACVLSDTRIPAANDTLRTMLLAVLSGFVFSAVAPFLFRALGRRAGWIVALVPLSLTAYFASFAPQVFAGEAPRFVVEWVPTMGASLSFRLDGLSLLFALIVVGIGTLIFVYAGGYMGDDPQTGRLYCLLLIFMASMVGLVTTDNLIALYIFWELTSISSYLLIGYKHGHEKSRKAALQALLVTGAGGLALLPGLVMLGFLTGTFEISELLQHGEAIRASYLYPAIVFCVLAGAFTKSAQFPFHFWLPSAMEAPTPISAYLHSATMVKAGVFLIGRFAPALGGDPLWNVTVVGVGATTMVVGAFLATQQSDLKSILAYTTVMALGTLTMLFGIGTEGAAVAAALYVVAHALYKGALFMVAGAIDHETGTRDIRRLGGLRAAMPITAAAAGLAFLSAAGIPALFGFLAKENVYLELLVSPALTAAAIVANVFVFAALAAVAYSAFYGAPVATPKRPHEVPLAMWLGPVVLGVLSVLLGLFPFLSDRFAFAVLRTLYAEAEPVHLALWHGLEGRYGVVLTLSVLTLALGLGAFRLRAHLLGFATRMARVYAYGPTRWYEAGLAALMEVARAQTRVLQNGYLRFYLLTVVGVTVVSAFYVLATRMPGAPYWNVADIEIYEVLLLGMMVAATIFVVRAESRLTAVVGLGIIGYGVSILFLLYGAPDLALTQFSIETLGVVLLVLVLYRLPEFIRASSAAARARDLVVALSVGALMTLLTLLAVAQPSESPLTRYYAEASYPLGFGRNVVNVILVDFRGLDTLGETTVLAIAALGVYALLRLRIEREAPPRGVAGQDDPQ